LTHKHVITGTGTPHRKWQGEGVDADRRQHDETASPESRFKPSFPFADTMEPAEVLAKNAEPSSERSHVITHL
jgi:hypothetical protein